MWQNHVRLVLHIHDKGSDHFLSAWRNATENSVYQIWLRWECVFNELDWEPDHKLFYCIQIILIFVCVLLVTKTNPRTADEN